MRIMSRHARPPVTCSTYGHPLPQYLWASRVSGVPTPTAPCALQHSTGGMCESGVT